MKKISETAFEKPAARWMLDWAEGKSARLAQHAVQADRPRAIDLLLDEGSLSKNSICASHNRCTDFG